MYNKYKGPKAEIENQSLDQAIKAKQGGSISLLNAAYYIVAYCASGAIVSGSSCVETMDVAATRATVSCGHDVPTPDRRCPGRSLNVCRALVNAIPVQKTNQAKRQPPTPIWLLLYTQPTPVLAHLSSRKAPRQDQPNTPPPNPPCLHIVTPQPPARTHRDPTKHQSSSSPPMRKRNPYRYLNALHENPGARYQKAKYSKFWTIHRSSSKSRIRRTCDDDAATSSRCVLPRCIHPSTQPCVVLISKSFRSATCCRKRPDAYRRP
jgi:hypothetical protein